MLKVVNLMAHGKISDVTRLVESENPEPGENEVLIEVVAAPINPSDILLIKGLYPRKVDFPFELGNEGVGRVLKTGSNVQNLSIGKLVLLPVGTSTWRDIVALDATRLFPLQVDDEQIILQLAMLSINPPTALLMLEDFVNLEKGDWVIQNAANSAVGRYLIQLAKIKGYKTINIVRREELVAELKNIGADEVLIDGEDLHKRVREIVGKEKIKLGIDAVAGEATDRLMRSLSRNATLVVYGAMSMQPMKANLGTMLSRDVTIRSFWLALWLQQSSAQKIMQTYQQLAELVIERKLFAKISKTFEIEQFQEALSFADTEAKGGKVLFIKK